MADSCFQSPAPPSPGSWVKLPHNGPLKGRRINPPKSPPAGRAPLPQRPQSPRPFPGRERLEREVRPSFQSPDRRQWSAHYPTGRCPALTAAFVPPHGTGTLQPQRVLGTMCYRRRLRCLRRRRRDTSRPCAATNGMMTGLSTTKLGFLGCLAAASAATSAAALSPPVHTKRAASRTPRRPKPPRPPWRIQPITEPQLLPPPP